VRRWPRQGRRSPQRRVPLFVVIAAAAAAIVVTVHGRGGRATGFQVLVEVRLEGERFPAPVARVVLVARVRHHVRAQVGPVRERFAALRARVRFLAGVRPQVALQQPRPAEHFAAHAARVRQLMREQVHGQRGHAHVRFAARVAPFRGLRVEAPVRLLVPGQVRRRGVVFAAVRARVPGCKRPARVIPRRYYRRRCPTAQGRNGRRKTRSPGAYGRPLVDGCRDVRGNSGAVARTTWER